MQKTFYVTEQEQERLDALREAAGMSASEYIRKLIDDAWLRKAASEVIEYAETGKEIEA